MIDSHLFDAYVAELEALRTYGRNLARTYPDIAERLNGDPRRLQDPQVERLVESAAFVAARLRLMIEETATELPMATLSMIAPTLVEPVPSMALLEFRGGTGPQTVARGARFDYQVGGQGLVCFSTTMDVTVAPFTVQLRRLDPSRSSPDGIGVRLVGAPPSRLLLCLGNDELSAAILMDAFTENLMSIEIVTPDGRMASRIPITRLRVHGFEPDEAALPVRPAVHHAHRLVTEFIVFPEKFRFVSLSLAGGYTPESGCEVQFRFSQSLPFPPRFAPDLITVNRVPAVNLWRSVATPFDIDGRQLEFPVRVDALRYRTVECHSIESVDLYGPESAQLVRLDPVLALGEIAGTTIRWGARRVVSHMGGEVLLYFQGLDYRTLGYQRFLTAPTVLASNRDVAEHAIVGARLESVEGGIGDWQSTLGSAPTAYRPALLGSQAMKTLIDYLQISMSGLVDEGRRGLLRDYLRHFPGGGEVGWIDGIESVGLSPVTARRGGGLQKGRAVIIMFNSERYRTTSQSMVKRVLGELFESQRGINQVEQIVVRAS